MELHIANLAELIEKKKAIRDGALEDLASGRTRLAGFHAKWVTVPFDKYLTLLKNNTYARDQLSEQGSVGNIHYGDILVKYGLIVSETDEIPLLKEGVPFLQLWRMKSKRLRMSGTR